MKKTGIFSGSFNPIHIGHLALANWLCEFEGLDEVWFLISPQNPLKKADDLMDDQLRLEMARVAVGNYPKFKVSDFEYALPRPTYTIHTLDALRAAFPDRTVYFIMGADNWHLFPQWKNYQDILTRYPILIYPRKGYPVEVPASYTNVKVVDAPEIEISSSFIRYSFYAGKDVSFFLPEKIRPYFNK